VKDGYALQLLKSKYEDCWSGKEDLNLRLPGFEDHHEKAARLKALKAGVIKK